MSDNKTSTTNSAREQQHHDRPAPNSSSMILSLNSAVASEMTVERLFLIMKAKYNLNKEKRE